MTESEPHIVIKSVPITMNFHEITHRRDPYLPDVRLGVRYGGLGLTVSCLFVVDGHLKQGHYHHNGYFYEHHSQNIYRGPDYSGGRRLRDDKDGLVTHFAYLPTCPHPDLTKPC